MDSSNVLLALDEQKKWRERRKRIRDRLRALERRRTTLREELEGVRKKILQYNRDFTDLRDGMPTGAVLPPSAQGRERWDAKWGLRARGWDVCGHGKAAAPAPP